MHLPRIEPFSCREHAIMVIVLFRYPSFKVFGKFCTLNLGVVPCSTMGKELRYSLFGGSHRSVAQNFQKSPRHNFST